MDMIPIRLLLIEDSEDDAQLIARHMRRGGIDLTLERVETASAMSAALSTRPPDIVISDNKMPTFDAESALQLLRDSGLDVPFIVVSGQIGEEAAAGLMRAGANDFVLKDSLTRLLPAVQRELREAAERHEQRRTRTALRTSEERFRLVAEHLQDVVFRYRAGPDPGMEYVSSAVVSMTGYQPEEIYGNPALILAMAEPEDQNTLMQSWETPSEQPLLMRCHGADGATMWIEYRAVAITDGAGRIVAVEGILRNLTTQMAAAEERESLQRQVHQAERLDSLGQLAGGIAHDFNNLLGVISGNADFVLDVLASDHPCRADVESISSAAAMAAALTRQLLIFGRHQPSQPEIIDLNIVVNDTRRLLQRTLGQDIDFVVQLEPDLDFVAIDRSRLEQIIMNLAVNARGAMPDGGRLTVATAAADETDPSWREAGLPAGRFVRLTVTDNGHGMEPEVARRAFEPFFTTKGPGNGTGLGLATVYGAVKEASGTVTLWSEPGKGTRFSIYLPAAERPAVPTPQAETATVDCRGERILVVDDNEAIRAIANRILTKAGYQVTEASTGDQAASLVADDNTDFDLLLTDVVMPGISASELIDRARTSRPGIAIALVSGHAADPTRGGRPLPEDIPIIAKPFNAGTLLSEVRKAIERSPAPGDEDPPELPRSSRLRTRN